MITGTAKDIVAYLMDADKEKLFDLEEHKEKKQRSLDSNAYFHVLVGKLAQALTPPLSKAACKNMLIADYGQPELDDSGAMIIYKTNAPPSYMEEQEHIHTKLIKVTIENDKNVYFYRVNRGTHTYNSAEMSKLIDGTVQECKNVGVETATFDELQHMKMLWKQKCAKNGNK